MVPKLIFQDLRINIFIFHRTASPKTPGRYSISTFNVSRVAGHCNCYLNRKPYPFPIFNMKIKTKIMDFLFWFLVVVLVVVVACVIFLLSATLVLRALWIGRNAFNQ